ncbi:GGDEF domain-containing response regulator [Rhodobium orientis]|uniref:diguanylate cyclase n=1 Tax=Rhodobium orientis TaxID=34017 RepID=A0A327JWX9_9HYPH|nr:diguanylate cyclase [Rhodobium orientis]MBK5949804.1 hypothetical protein [Rhodobium orientis]RAI30086.1 hypothetical protein CH339_00715 [Rhodobium orientis]
MEILLAETSRLGRRVIAEMLERRGDVVHCCGDGHEALRELHDNPDIDVLLTSIELPGVCGLELCWDARILAETRAPIYIIIMSSSRERSMLVEVLDSGANDFFRKPPLEAELHARMRSAERLLKAQREILWLSQTDSLTGVLNRRHFFSLLGEEIERLSGDPLSLVMLDIDRFKGINDRYGHDIGDKVIQSLAAQFNGRTGIFGRVGGEEFCWALPGCPLSLAVDMAEEVRIAIESGVVASPLGPIRFTSSLGVAQHHAGDTVEDLSRRADEALYDAKESGRNRVSTRLAKPPQLLTA